MIYNKPKILIVDDVPKNITVIANSLKTCDYDIAYAVSGKAAFEVIDSSSIDLILLDIMMPEMDGYEVCKKLKKNPKTCSIPIIFITAKINKEDEIKGFQVGAVDFITKPITPLIVQARVKAQISLRQAQQKLEEQNNQIIAASKLQDDIMVMCRHDIKNPLSYIITCSEMTLEKEPLTEKTAKRMQGIYRSALTILDMVNQSLDLVKMEKKTYQCTIEQLNLSLLLKSIFEENKILLHAKDLNIVIQHQQTPLELMQNVNITTDKLLCYSMLSNLIRNSIEASPNSQPITINLGEKSGYYLFSIHNFGSIPKSIQAHFFDKYISYGKEGGNGLGTYSAKLMAKTLGGDITFETSEENGTQLKVSIKSNLAP